MPDTEFGIQEDGSFSRKYIEDIQESLLTVAEAKFGDRVDLAPGSPPRQLIDIATIELADLWESLEGTYYASYFPDAVGVQIDRILSLVGVSRIPRRGATGEVTFMTPSENAEDITIPKGVIVTTSATESSPSIPFRTTESATLLAGESAVTNVPIRALEPWETDVDKEYLGEKTNVGSGTINEMVDRIAGVPTVTNPLPTGASGVREDGTDYDFQLGRDRENDHQLKERYRNSLALGGRASLLAIRANVANVEGVTTAAIEENTSMNDNRSSGGLPQKSFRVTAIGGDDDEIAQSILDTRSAGIQAYGDEFGIGTTDDGDEYKEYFDRGDSVSVYVDVTLDVLDTFPADGVTQVKDRIINYVGGTTTNGDSVVGRRLGNDIIYDQVFAASMNVEGVNRSDVTIGQSESLQRTSDMYLDKTELGVTDASKIRITVNQSN